MRFLVNSTFAITLALGISACEPIEPAVEEDPVTCTPYGLVNDRVNGLGMDLCSDGSVVNWDGLLVGHVIAVEGDSVTIKWSLGSNAGATETFIGRASTCRQDGTLKDC
jgi:hypothetical protein